MTDATANGRGEEDPSASPKKIVATHNKIIRKDDPQMIIQQMHQMIITGIPDVQSVAPPQLVVLVS